MGNTSDDNSPGSIADFVNDSVVADANPPAVFVTMKLLAANRAGVVGQLPDFRQDSFDSFGREIV